MTTLTRISTHSIDPGAMGVELSWSFGYGDAEAVTVPRSVVKAILEMAGFEPALYLEEMDPSNALKRAALLAPRRKKTSIKELARPNRDAPRVWGIYTRVAKDGESGDGWVMGARVRAVGDRVVAAPPEGEHSYTSMVAKEIALTMERRANSLLGNVFNGDLSAMLTAVGASLGWINRRRNSGGVYFMHAGRSAERFVKLLLDIKAETESHHPSRQFVPEIVEVFPKPLTKATIADAATYHFESKIDKLVGDLRKAADLGKMRESTMDKRMIEIDALMVQAEEYRSILAEGSTAIADRLSECRKHFATGVAEGCEALERELAEFDKLAPPTPPVTLAIDVPEPVEEPTAEVDADPFADIAV